MARRQVLRDMILQTTNTSHSRGSPVSPVVGITMAVHTAYSVVLPDGVIAAPAYQMALLLPFVLLQPSKRYPDNSGTAEDNHTCSPIMAS